MHFNSAVCTVKHVNADLLEQIVIDKLSELSGNEDYLRTSVEELNRDLKRKAEPLEREAAQVNKRLQEIEQEISRYAEPGLEMGTGVGTPMHAGSSCRTPRVGPSDGRCQ